MPLHGRCEPRVGRHSLTPTASGVLAVKLSASKPENRGVRKERLLAVTGGGTRPAQNRPLNSPIGERSDVMGAILKE